MTEKRQTLHGYIIRILQHFATKLWNITNFVMLQAVMKFLSRLVEIKMLSITQVVNCLGNENRMKIVTCLRGGE
jgi:valyl-tRNA synthetase